MGKRLFKGKGEVYHKYQVPYPYIDEFGNLAIGDGYVIKMLDTFSELEWLAHTLYPEKAIRDKRIPAHEIAKSVTNEHFDKYLRTNRRGHYMSNPDMQDIFETLVKLPFHEGALIWTGPKKGLRYIIWDIPEHRKRELLVKKLEFLVKLAAVFQARAYLFRDEFPYVPPEATVWDLAPPDECESELVLTKYDLDRIGILCNANSSEDDETVALMIQDLKEGDVEGCNFMPRADSLIYRENNPPGSHRVFITDIHHVTNALGELDYTKNIQEISSLQAYLLAVSLGISYGKTKFGGTLSIFVDIPDRDPRPPTQAEVNAHFQGHGKGIPGGGPELTIRPFTVPATDRNIHQMELKVNISKKYRKFHSDQICKKMRETKE